MSGYPGGAYPGAGGGYPAQGGYPGSAGGYPGGAPGGGYPGGQGGYPGQQGGGYPGGSSAPPMSSAPPTSGGYGGYGGAAPPPSGYGAPPQVDPNVASWFHAVDQDRSGQITAHELQKALVNGNWSNFSEEACRMMIGMFDRSGTGTLTLETFGQLFHYVNQWKALFEGIDRDRSGYIEFNELSQDMFDKNASGSIDVNEFGQLFSYINQWKAVFEGLDKDRNCFLENAEVQQALNQMGYRFSPTFVQNLLAKFDPRTRRLTLDNFIVASVQLKRLTDSFRTRDREMRGQATLQYEDFVGLSMGVHK